MDTGSLQIGCFAWSCKLKAFPKWGVSSSHPFEEDVNCLRHHPFWGTPFEGNLISTFQRSTMSGHGKLGSKLTHLYGNWATPSSNGFRPAYPHEYGHLRYHSVTSVIWVIFSCSLSNAELVNEASVFVRAEVRRVHRPRHRRGRGWDFQSMG